MFLSHKVGKTHKNQSIIIKTVIQKINFLLANEEILVQNKNRRLNPAHYRNFSTLEYSIGEDETSVFKKLSSTDWVYFHTQKNFITLKFVFSSTGKNDKFHHTQICFFFNGKK